MLFLLLAMYLFFVPSDSSVLCALSPPSEVCVYSSILYSLPSCSSGVFWSSVFSSSGSSLFWESLFGKAFFTIVVATPHLPLLPQPGLLSSPLNVVVVGTISVEGIHADHYMMRMIKDCLSLISTSKKT